MKDTLNRVDVTVYTRQCLLHIWHSASKKKSERAWEKNQQDEETRGGAVLLGLSTQA